MAKMEKFDNLMRDLSQGKIKEDSEEIVPRMEEVLTEENMGTFDQMMNDIMDYLEAKNKHEQYLDDNGMMKLPFELIFSWFSSSITKHREMNTKDSIN